MEKETVVLAVVFEDLMKELFEREGVWCRYLTPDLV